VSTAKRFFIETWGCQMNQLDSQRMAGQLMKEGLLPERSPDAADVILLNSCSIREKAEQKVVSRLGEYRLLKRQRAGLVIGLCGCVAQQEGDRALAAVPDLDFVLGTARVGELPEVLRRTSAGERVVLTGFPAERTYDFESIARDGLHKGMVTIIEGCNKNCTFCVVPMTRGAERCRTMADILAEVQHLLDYGFIEIELLGQTVNHWRQPGGVEDFADLLDAVASMPGLKRLRFVTSYPRDFSSRMIDQVARHANICPYLHLPAQSGSDQVLRRMGRGYTRSQYIDLVHALRAARPELALSTDIIVGFPGESESEFEESCDLVREVRFAAIFAFKYSPRPGTAAPRLGPPVHDPVASERLQRLLALQNQIQLELNEHLVGEEMDVLITGPSREIGTWMGRTACHRIVHFPQKSEAPEVGSLVPVQISQALRNSLLGVAV
jgi:tRNA-2-methylthio-N6-dimethylallyladenosine synthase